LGVCLILSMVNKFLKPSKSIIGWPSNNKWETIANWTNISFFSCLEKPLQQQHSKLKDDP
jgi:hypothetical protein